MKNSAPKEIDSLEFGLMSPEDYREMSATKIITADTYDDDGFPIEMGLMDPRLGVVDPGLECRTCGKRSGQCKGHFGHIELAAPVIHPGFAKLVYRLLRGTCQECGRILLEDIGKINKAIREIGKTKDIVDNIENDEKQEKLKDLLEKIEEQAEAAKKEKKARDETADKAEKTEEIIKEAEKILREEAKETREEAKQNEEEQENEEQENEEESNEPENEEEQENEEQENEEESNEPENEEEQERDEEKIEALLEKLREVSKQAQDLDVDTVTIQTIRDIAEDEKELTLEEGKRCYERTIKERNKVLDRLDRFEDSLEDIEKEEIVDDIKEHIQKSRTEIQGVKQNFKNSLDRTESLGGDLDEVTKDALRKASKQDNCTACASPQDDIDHEKPTTFYSDGEKMTPSDVRDRLEIIPNEDLKSIGINENSRPEWAVLTVLPVPPVTMRPSITLDNGQRSEDDLTHKLVDVIRINQRFVENKEAGSPQLIMEDLWELLQYHVTTFMDNEVSGAPPANHRSGRPLKTLSQRLKGKDGRFRGSLSGKRVNFSSRSVISPDPNISLNEIGVPERIAKETTQKVKVTRENIKELSECVRRGPENHPGANYITKDKGRRVKIGEENSEDLAEEMLESEEIEETDSEGKPKGLGWEVERHLKNGDIVLFNRQPSLHRMSMMAHEVVVMPGRTFRLNTTVCPPYNADFDGDEMNMHVLQGEEARAEARVLMRVQEHILSPRFGGPIMGGIQDHISGLYLLTRDGTKFDKGRASELLSETSVDIPDREEGEEVWTGRELFSSILPDVTLKFESSTGETVKIEDGEMTDGIIDEAAVGAFVGEIINKITKTYSESEAKRFIDDLAALAVKSIMHFGFSFGIDDEDLPKQARKEMQKEVNNAREEVQRLIQRYEDGELESLPGRTVEETLELKIMQELGKARDSAGEIAEEYLEDDNPGVIMAVSGARGSMLNLTQMTGCVGQQAIRGERISRGYDGRTLSHFKRGDRGAEAHGFVENSYKEGLDPTEFFFHAMGGREGLVDTAVRTSKSGYLQRRLINALQELSAEYDRTVRTTTGKVVQFDYGEDGADPMKLGGTETEESIIEYALEQQR